MTKIFELPPPNVVSFLVYIGVKQKQPRYPCFFRPFIRAPKLAPEKTQPAQEKNWPREGFWPGSHQWQTCASGYWFQPQWNFNKHRDGFFLASVNNWKNLPENYIAVWNSKKVEVFISHVFFSLQLKAFFLRFNMLVFRDVWCLDLETFVEAMEAKQHQAISWRILNIANSLLIVSQGFAINIAFKHQTSHKQVDVFMFAVVHLPSGPYFCCMHFVDFFGLWVFE